MRACLLALIERNRALNWEVTIRAMLPPLPGETAIRVQGETLADRRLPAFAFDQVFEEGGFKNGSQYGRRRVAYVRKDDLWLVFKLNPELPGVESAAGHLSRLIFGSWMSPLTELMRWQDQFPVLVSGGVPGVTLQDALTDNPDGACALVAALMFAPMASALRVTTWRSAGRPGRVVGSSPSRAVWRISLLPLCVVLVQGWPLSPLSHPATVLRVAAGSSSTAGPRVRVNGSRQRHDPEHGGRAARELHCRAP